MLVAQISTIELVVLLIVGVFLVVVFAAVLQPFQIWFTAFLTGVSVPLSQVIGMRFRKVDARTVVRTLIMTKQAGIELSCEEVERAYLHEDVGLVLEELYGERADEVCVQLVRHFEEAGVEEKARHYLYQAGEQARRGYAHAEAVAYLSRALELTPEADYAERYAILTARERAYDMQGAREAQQGDLAALAELAEALNDDQKRAEVALRWAWYREETSDYPAAITAAQQAIALAQAAGLVKSEAAGYLQWGRALMRQGDYPAARVQLEEGLRLARGAGLSGVEADSLRALGIVAYYQDGYAGGRCYWEQALSLYREAGDRRGEGAMLNNLALAARMTSDYDRERASLEQALALSRKTGVTDVWLCRRKKLNHEVN